MDKNIKTYTVQEILAKDPFDLAEEFTQEYTYTIPETIDNINDLKEAGRLLGVLTNVYSYLAQLSMYAKIDIRNKRRQKNKADVDDAVDRKAVIDTFVDTVGMQYKAVSRMLTVKQQINEELKMSDGKI